MRLLEHFFRLNTRGPADLLDEDDQRRQRDVRQLNRALMPLLSLAALAAIIEGYQADALAAVMLWAVTCVSAGGTVGFLFGIPRSGFNKFIKGESETDSAQADSGALTAPGRVTPNTNLEEVSDWLTKIIVGLTLVHLDQIRDNVASISVVMAASLRSTPAVVAVSFAAALVVGFFVLGFLCGYLYTRLILQGAFERSNQSVIRRQHFNSVVTNELSAIAVESAPSDIDARPVPSSEERESAQRVYRATTLDQLDSVLKSIKALAQEYEQLRASMPSGDERAGAISNVVKRMTVFSLAAVPLLPQLTCSNSPGERLAASVILRMQFDPGYIDWLGTQLKGNRAYPVLQALRALRAGMEQGSAVDRERIKQVVGDARSIIERHAGVDSSRIRIVDEILSMDAA